MPEAPRIVNLDEFEAIPGPGSLVWHPVRATLGVRAFGCNAYTAREVGQDVVEPHTEEDQEEIYFVARGRARFTIDGQDHDAPTGTYVFLPDPTSHRHAVALEPGTTVLSFGGPATFEPSAWEWYFRADPLLRSDPIRAREILREGLSVHPDSANMHYTLACLEALEGRPRPAIEALTQALRHRPGLRDRARTDEDLVALANDPGFRALVGS